MSSSSDASPTEGKADGIKRWWQTSSRKDKGWAIVTACALGVVLLSFTDDGSDSDDYARAVEQQTMQSIAGVDTPGEACTAGYDWACDVTKTDYKPVSSVYVYTEIPAADIQGARVVAYAYYMSVPDLEEVVVINRGGGEFEGLTRQDLQDMPGL